MKSISILLMAAAITALPPTVRAQGEGIDKRVSITATSEGSLAIGGRYAVIDYGRPQAKVLKIVFALADTTGDGSLRITGYFAPIDTTATQATVAGSGTRYLLPYDAAGTKVHFSGRAVLQPADPGNDNSFRSSSASPDHVQIRGEGFLRSDSADRQGTPALGTGTLNMERIRGAMSLWASLGDRTLLRLPFPPDPRFFMPFGATVDVQSFIPPMYRFPELTVALLGEQHDGKEYTFAPGDDPQRVRQLLLSGRVASVRMGPDQPEDTTLYGTSPRSQTNLILPRYDNKRLYVTAERLGLSDSEYLTLLPRKSANNRTTTRNPRSLKMEAIMYNAATNSSRYRDRDKEDVVRLKSIPSADPQGVRLYTGTHTYAVSPRNKITYVVAFTPAAEVAMTEPHGVVAAALSSVDSSEMAAQSGPRTVVVVVSPEKTDVAVFAYQTTGKYSVNHLAKGYVVGWYIPSEAGYTLGGYFLKPFRRGGIALDDVPLHIDFIGTSIRLPGEPLYLR